MDCCINVSYIRYPKEGAFLLQLEAETRKDTIWALELELEGSELSGTLFIREM